MAEKRHFVSVPIRGLFYLTFLLNERQVLKGLTWCFRPHQGIILFNI